MADHIKVAAATGRWIVRAEGAILGETENALEITEGAYPAVIYFPRADIATAFLDPSDTTSHCPWKGDASYYSIQTNSALIKDAAWSYEKPTQEMKAISGHLAFYSDKVKVQQG